MIQNTQYRPAQQVNEVEQHDRFESVITSLLPIMGRLERLFTDPGFRSEVRGLAKALLQLFPEDASNSGISTESPLESQKSSTFQGVAEPFDHFHNDHPDNSPLSSGDRADSSPVSPRMADSRSDQPRASTEQVQSLIERFSGNDTRVAKPAPQEIPQRLAPEPTTYASEAVALAIIEKRCRMKSESSRWAAERRRRMTARADFKTEIEPTDQDIIARAKQIESCYLWMNNPRGPEPRDLEDFETLAHCFEAQADAIALTKSVLTQDSPDDDDLHKVLLLLAEAQSMLRVQVTTVGHQFDQDQRDLFYWLRQFSSRYSVYLERYMQTADAANPQRVDEFQERLEEVRKELAQKCEVLKQSRKLLQKLRFECRESAKSRAAFNERAEKLIQVVDQLVLNGMKPSNIELRGCLLPIVDWFEDMEELSESMVLVLREIERFVSRNVGSSEEAPQEAAFSNEVREVAKALMGKSIFLIGGERRPTQQQAIEKAFELQTLVWDTTLEHSSLDKFIPIIEREDIFLVLLAIRWSSHSYSEIDEVCKKCSKILVRLPGGMHPNQIAHQILAQASHRLMD